MKNPELWIAPLFAILLTARCSKGVTPPEPQAAKSPEEKVYTTKDVEKLAAQPTPSPSPEAVQERAEVSEPVPSPSAAPRATPPVVAVPGQYTNADLDKLPPVGQLPPPIEGGSPTTDAQEAQGGNRAPEAGTVYTNKDLKDLPERAPTEQPPRQN